MLLAVRVQTRSSRNALAWQQGTLKIYLTAAPVDGAANQVMVALLADRLGLPRRNFTILRGATSLQKLLEITGITPEEMAQKLQ